MNPAQPLAASANLRISPNNSTPHVATSQSTGSAGTCRERFPLLRSQCIPRCRRRATAFPGRFQETACRCQRLAAKLHPSLYSRDCAAKKNVLLPATRPCRPLLRFQAGWLRRLPHRDNRRPSSPNSNSPLHNLRWRSQKSLRARQHPAQAPVARTRHAQSPCERFEERFNLVMAGAPIEHASVNICARAASKTLEEIAHQFHLQISHERRPNLGIHRRRRTSSEVHRRQTEGFVHRHHEITGAQNAAAISQGAVERLAQSNSYVFHRVVLVHIQVANGRQLEIECAVPRKQLQHVIQKANSSRDLVPPASFYRERNPNLGLRSFAMQFGLSHALTSRGSLSCETTSRRAPIKVRVCSRHPTVRRTQPSHP